MIPGVPLVSASGFENGRGLTFAISLGADGIGMGSRFAIKEESGLACKMKEIVLSGDSTVSDTLYGKNFDGIPARVIKSEESIRLMNHPAPLPVVIYCAFNGECMYDVINC